MALDLGVTNLAEQAEAGYTFEVLHPVTEEGTGAFITVRGDQSKIVQAFGRKRFAVLQKKQQKQGKNADFSLDELEEMAVEAAVVRIKNWKGFEDKGSDIPFTKENAISILTEHPWIRTAVTEAAENLENFHPS